MSEHSPDWARDASDPEFFNRSMTAAQKEEAEAKAAMEAGPAARLGEYGHRAMMNPRATPPRKGKPKPEGTPPTPPGGEGDASGEDDTNNAK